MYGEKDWWRSKTVWGGLISLAGIMLAALGVALDDATRALLTEQWTALVVAAMTFGGTVLSIYGRISAERRIK